MPPPVLNSALGLGRRLTLPDPLRLDSGVELAGAKVAYSTYGAFDPDNAVLICHALTGNQHVASPDLKTGKPGWWEAMVGAGRPIDPTRNFVLCANVLGGCSGSTGPCSTPPGASRPYGSAFPAITIGDMVRAQAAWLDQLGVKRLKAVVGGSMGGAQALAWASLLPERVRAAVVIASAARHSAQNIAFHEVGRAAIMADPDWNGGDYDGAGPVRGLAVARMAAHVTYLSERALTERFGRQLRNAGQFEVESYLHHQGARFVERFDANSYIAITRALDAFDLAEAHGGSLARAFSPATRFCVVSFDSDWLYPTAESRAIVRALNACGAPVSFVELSSPHGHDAFLLDQPDLRAVVGGFLGSL
ncbi:MAG: homoserine O-acetyltransferase [Sphingomonadaceae bacterium]|nr:homoserine O-acetyltransferase [Sphingomonadaceae bacterium]